MSGAIQVRVPWRKKVSIAHAYNIYRIHAALHACITQTGPLPLLERFSKQAMNALESYCPALPRPLVLGLRSLAHFVTAPSSIHADLLGVAILRPDFANRLTQAKLTPDTAASGNDIQPVAVEPYLIWGHQQAEIVGGSCCYRGVGMGGWSEGPWVRSQIERRKTRVGRGMLQNRTMR
jgi:hypothetical protein